MLALIDRQFGVLSIHLEFNASIACVHLHATGRGLHFHWLLVREGNGPPGFIAGQTHISLIKQVVLNQPRVTAYVQPTAGSPVGVPPCAPIQRRTAATW